MKFKYKIYDDSLDQLSLDKRLIINTINAHCYCTAEKDTVYRKSLMSSDILLPDGISVVWALNFLEGKKIKKISGYDIFVYLMHKINQIEGKVFFLGSTEKILNKIENKIKIEYPKVRVSHYSPPFKNEFNDRETSDMINKINEFKPMVLFVGMTAPKQEKWIYKNSHEISATNICNIGAVFDFYSGATKRAPNWMLQIGLEWFHRSFTSRRLFLRNFRSNPLFVYKILRRKFKK